MDQSDRKFGEYVDIPINYNEPFEAVRNDAEAHNFFIANNGIRFHHWAAVPDPIGEVKVADARDSYQEVDNNQFDANNQFYKENGFLYFYRGEVLGIFQGNSNKLNQTYAGLYTSSGAMITFNKFYKGTEKVVSMSEFDKLIPCDLDSELKSVNWEKFQFNSLGINRTQFCIKEVEFLIDSAGVAYTENVDFVIEKGNIKWIAGGNWPGIDPRSNEGRVCSVRYTYKPYFYIKMFMHDIRVRPEIQSDGTIEMKSSNISAQVVSDFVFLDARTKDDTNQIQQIMHGRGSNEGPR